MKHILITRTDCDLFKTKQSLLKAINAFPDDACDFEVGPTMISFNSISLGEHSKYFTLKETVTLSLVPSRIK